MSSVRLLARKSHDDVLQIRVEVSIYSLKFTKQEIETTNFAFGQFWPKFLSALGASRSVREKEKY